MGRIHHREVKPDELLERAAVVVIARLADPPRRNEVVSIARKTRDGKR